MTPISIVDDLAVTLHANPLILNTVGGRVTQSGEAGDTSLPNIVLETVPIHGNNKPEKVRVICRAKTPGEADRVGNAVVTALSEARVGAKHMQLVKVTDRSGYDHASGAFRRVIFLDLRP